MGQATTTYNSGQNAPFLFQSLDPICKSDANAHKEYIFGSRKKVQNIFTSFTFCF